MTQAQLAHALGISQPQVSARLRGDTPITLDEIDALARIFGTTADAILAGTQSSMVNSAQTRRRLVLITDRICLPWLQHQTRAPWIRPDPADTTLPLAS